MGVPPITSRTEEQIRSAPRMEPRTSDAQLAFGGSELIQRELEIFSRMRRRHLSAQTRLSLGHNWIGETDNINAAGEHRIGQALREHRVSEHDRHDRMGAGQTREPNLRDAFAEK